MTDTTVSAADSFGELVLVESDLVCQEVKRAVAGFLADYRGQPMTSYRIDITKVIAWLDTTGVPFRDILEAASNADPANDDARGPRTRPT